MGFILRNYGQPGTTRIPTYVLAIEVHTLVLIRVHLHGANGVTRLAG